MLYIEFHPWNFMFFYIIIKITMLSTNITLNVHIILKLLMSDNPHCLTYLLVCLSCLCATHKQHHRLYFTYLLQMELCVI